jgi:LysM repeat protein
MNPHRPSLGCTFRLFSAVVFITAVMALAPSLMAPGAAASASSLLLVTPTVRPSTYVVQPGDTLFRIALRFNTTVAALQAANQLSSDLIYPGQVLVLPAALSFTPAAPTGVAVNPSANGAGTYIVRPGDNLFRIALNRGTTVTALMAANGLTSIRIYPGQVLIIPGAGSTAPVAASPSPTAPAPSNPTASSAPPAPAGGTYVVQRGDTLFNIARRFNLSVSALMAANTIWMAEGLTTTYNPLFDGLYVYRIDHRDFPQAWLKQPRWASALRAVERQGSLPLGGLYFTDTIAAGFDDTRSVNAPGDLRSDAPHFARDRRSGGYYTDTFAVTAQTGGDFLLVKSFNEWIEGSEIEPGTTYGDLYLNLTCQFANTYRSR